MMTLTEIKAHLSSNKVPYIIGILLFLSSSLFVVIWQRWLYGLLAQYGQVVPRQVLGAIIGVLLIALLALFALVILYARELSALKKTAPAPPEIKSIEIEENHVAIMKCLADYHKIIESNDIAGHTRLHLQVVKFHLQQLLDAKYVHLHGSQFFSLAQRGREYLIKNNLLT
jgi:hypothetical protein